MRPLVILLMYKTLLTL